MTRRFPLAALLGAVAALAGCQEKLLTPGDCPALCPGGRITVYDTILTPIPGSDSTFAGYVSPGLADAMLVSNGAPAADARGFIRFIPRSDSVLILDTLRSYAIDSVRLRFSILGRDSLQPGLRLNVYRLPATMDSSVTFTDLNAVLTPSALIESIALPDTLLADTISVMLRGTALDRVALTPPDSGVLKLGLGLDAPAATGVRVASLISGSPAPLFTTFITVNIADTSRQKDNIGRGPIVTTYKTATPSPSPTPQTLVLGGAPSARVLLRFELPQRLRDSAEFVRATLELIPTGPLVGVANIPSQVQVKAVLADLGAKSPVSGNDVGTRILGGTVTDTVRVDIVQQVRNWRAGVLRPQAMFVALSPEASSFLVPVFGSTGNPALQPRLRIEYVLPFGFVAP